MPFNLQVQDRSGDYALAGGRALAAGIEQAGSGIARIFEAMARKKEQEKQEAKLAVSLRKTLKDLDAAQALREGREPAPATFDLMGPDDLKGAFEAVGINARLEREAAALEYVKNQIAAQRRAEARARAFPGLARRLGELGQEPENVPSPLSNEEFARRTSPITPQGVLAEMGTSGYVPEGLSEFDDIIRAFTPKGGGAMPGTIRSVPGLEGYVFGVQSDTGAGTFLALPKPDGGGRTPQLTEVLIGGQPSGWLVNEKGRYLRKPKAEDPFDFSQFDSNGDGELNEQEAQQANLAAAMKKAGIAYPGLKITGGRAGAGAEGENLFEQFQKWRGK
jgi:hypothetical protein